MCQEKKGPRRGQHLLKMNPICYKPESSSGRKQLSCIRAQVLEDKEVEIDIGHK